MATFRLRGRAHPALAKLPADQPVIYCIWHNRLALSIRLYQMANRIRGCHRRMATLVSASHDGGILAEVLERFDAQPVRGSSSRRGPQALREMSTWIRRGLDAAITPDGPRGPRYRLQEGVLSLAQVTGRPIVTVGVSVRWKFHLKSWDRFLIPIPFTRCDYEFSEPIEVPRRMFAEEKEALRRRLESTLCTLNPD